MTNLLHSITGTRNLFINCAIATLLTVLIVGFFALVGNLIFNPGLVNNASFGL